MTDPTLIDRPWLSEVDRGRDHGREEIVGPGRLGHITKPIESVVRRSQVAMGLAGVCESPIEVMLGAAIDAYLAGAGLRMIAQYHWLRFRVDFAIIRDVKPLVFVECDGKEFHSTPKQIANDRRKDAAARALGIPLMRFTGSDIYRRADWCAYLVVDAAAHR